MFWRWIGSRDENQCPAGYGAIECCNGWMIWKCFGCEQTETPSRKNICVGLNSVRRLDQLHGRHNFAEDGQCYLHKTPPSRESAYRHEMIF